MKNCIIANSRSWFSLLDDQDSLKNYKFIEIQTNDDLSKEFLEKINPCFIFFVHWNWKVPDWLHQQYESVVFHAAPLPFGRGGSPIQNLILRGFETTPVCALRMNEILDGGDIYSSKNISLDGSLEDILNRINIAVNKLIIDICSNDITPKKQSGDIVQFKRLTTSDNEIPQTASTNAIYDRIRMLDAEDYPNAFIQYGDHTIYFSNAILENGKIKASVEIKNNDD